MAIAQPFDYVKPASLKAAVSVLAKAGQRGRVLAGGTDLVGQLQDGSVQPSIVVDIKGLDELKKLKFQNGRLQIGALVTFGDILESAMIRQKFPVFAEMAGWVASNGVRHRATMVGNICSAVPCCDSGPILLVYDSTVLLKGPRGSRRVKLEDWFTGPRKTCIRPGEIVVGVEVKQPKQKHAAAFVKMRRYEGEDLAQASVTALLNKDRTWRISFGSVAPTPVPGHKIEKMLKGQALTDDLIRQAVALLPKEIAPITDIRATKEYRMHMIGVMLERGLRAANDRLAGRGPAYGTSLI
jgi:CO/xanthine dehydrogenase FAD-binding subunit